MKSKQEEQFAKLRCDIVADKPMTHECAQYEGNYSHPGYGEIAVCHNPLAEHALALQVHGNVFPLIHMHYDVFRMELMEMPVPVIFRTGIAGDICAVDIQMEPSLPEMISYLRVPGPENSEQPQ